MYGKRLIVGAVIMMVGVPLSIMFLLEIWGWRPWFVISMTSLSGWGLGDLIATLLTRSRDQQRTARSLLDVYAISQDDETDRIEQVD